MHLERVPKPTGKSAKHWLGIRNHINTLLYPIGLRLQDHKCYAVVIDIEIEIQIH